MRLLKIFITIFLLVCIFSGCMWVAQISFNTKVIFEPDKNVKIVSQKDWEKVEKIIKIRLQYNNIDDYKTSVDYKNNKMIVLLDSELKGSESLKDTLNEICKIGNLTFCSPDDKVILEGKDIKRAYYDTIGRDDIVRIDFTAEGTEKFADATTQYTGKQISIYIDDELISAPKVEVPILDGQCYIQGKFTEDYVKNLADIIDSGSLPFKLNAVIED